MWWSEPITVTKGTTRDSPVETTAKLVPGTVRRVRVRFRPGAGDFVKVTIWRHEHQWLPESADGYISGDNETVDLPVHYEVKEIPATLRVVCWNTATLYDHEVTVGIYVRPGGLAGMGDLLRDLFLGGGQ